MATVSITGLVFAYAEATPILDHVTLHLERGATALVGSNGAGKTTLLRLLTGELRPQAGRIELSPRDARVVVCPQTVERDDALVEALASRDDREARRVCALLAAPRDELARWPTLSPGERKRLQLAAALLAEPDVLLLDEPQNHLDRDARAVLEAVIGEARCCVILVSHDRALLDACTSRTVRLERGRVRVFPGPFSEAAAHFRAEDEARAFERETLVAAAQKAKRALVDARRTHAAAERSLSRGQRMKGPRDSDARSVSAQMRAERAEGHLGRAVAGRKVEAERAEARAAAIEVEKSLGGSMMLGYTPSPRPWVLSWSGTLRVEDRVLAEGSYRLARDGRVWLSGPNGAGKSSLLRALSASRSDQVLHLPQTLGEADGRAYLARLRALPRDHRGRVLQCVAALGVDPARLLASEDPSPGEARKLALSFGLGLHAWALVLDEPENHLDLPSIERLEAALRAFPGALLLVTHDEQLAARCTTERWELGADRRTMAR